MGDPTRARRARAVSGSLLGLTFIAFFFLVVIVIAALQFKDQIAATEIAPGSHASIGEVRKNVSTLDGYYKPRPNWRTFATSWS